MPIILDIQFVLIQSLEFMGKIENERNPYAK